VSRKAPVDVDTTWQDHAKCTKRGDVFGPLLNMPTRPNKPLSDNQVAQIERARTWCGICTVRQECAEYAATMHCWYGMWGGEMPWERREREHTEQVRIKRVSSIDTARRRRNGDPAQALADAMRITARELSMREAAAQAAG
jgi:hypothetical protein